MEVLEAIGQILWVLILTGGILVLAYWSTRRMAGSLAVKYRGSRMEILDQMPLGREQKLVLARVGDTVYLLGVSSGGISCLRTLTKEETEGWLAPPSERDAGGTDSGSLRFREALRRVLEQRKP